MRHNVSRTNGQVTVEVAVLFGVVVAALVAMANYVQRGVAGGMRSNADSFGSQYQTNKKIEVHSRSVNIDDGGNTRSVQRSANCQALGAETTAPNTLNPNCDSTTAEYPEITCPDGMSFDKPSGRCKSS